MCEMKAIVGDIAACEWKGDATYLTYKVPASVAVDHHKSLIVKLGENNICTAHYHDPFSGGPCSEDADFCIVRAMQEAEEKGED